ncbi:MAG: hypothetical protein Q8L52_01205 [bacterium]|nr:hypothetical protein [bacterium]
MARKFGTGNRPPNHNEGIFDPNKFLRDIERQYLELGNKYGEVVGPEVWNVANKTLDEIKRLSTGYKELSTDAQKNVIAASIQRLGVTFSKAADAIEQKAESIALLANMGLSNEFEVGKPEPQAEVAPEVAVAAESAEPRVAPQELKEIFGDNVPLRSIEMLEKLKGKGKREDYLARLRADETERLAKKESRKKRTEQAVSPAPEPVAQATVETAPEASSVTEDSITPVNSVEVTPQAFDATQFEMGTWNVYNAFVKKLESLGVEERDISRVAKEATNAINRIQKLLGKYKKILPGGDSQERKDNLEKQLHGALKILNDVGLTAEEVAREYLAERAVDAEAINGLDKNNLNLELVPGVTPNQRQQDKFVKALLANESDVKGILNTKEVQVTPEEHARAIEALSGPEAQKRAAEILHLIGRDSSSKKLEEYRAQYELLLQQAEEQRVAAAERNAASSAEPLASTQPEPVAHVDNAKIKPTQKRTQRFGPQDSRMRNYDEDGFPAVVPDLKVNSWEPEIENAPELSRKRSKTQTPSTPSIPAVSDFIQVETDPAKVASVEKQPETVTRSPRIRSKAVPVDEGPFIQVETKIPPSEADLGVQLLPTMFGSNQTPPHEAPPSTAANAPAQPEVAESALDIAKREVARGDKAEVTPPQEATHDFLTQAEVDELLRGVEPSQSSTAEVVPPQPEAEASPKEIYEKRAGEIKAMLEGQDFNDAFWDEDGMRGGINPIDEAEVYAHYGRHEQALEVLEEAARKVASRTTAAHGEQPGAVQTDAVDVKPPQALSPTTEDLAKDEIRRMAAEANADISIPKPNNDAESPAVWRYNRDRRGEGEIEAGPLSESELSPEPDGTQDWRARWKGKLREAVGKVVGGAKERLGGVSERGRQLAGYLAERGKALDAQGAELSEKYFGKLGESYNKLPTWQKIALGGSLAMGLGFTSSWIAGIYGTALVATRFAAMAGSFKSNEEKLQAVHEGKSKGGWIDSRLNKWLGQRGGTEREIKNVAMAKALVVSLGMTAALGYGAKLLSDYNVAERFGSWIGEHVYNWTHADAGAQAVGASASEVIPAPGGSSPSVQAAGAQRLAELHKPDITHLMPDHSAAAAGEAAAATPAFEAPVVGASARGYEGMLQDLMKQLPDTRPEGLNPKSDLARLFDAKADPGEIHRLAIDHDFFKGGSVRIDPSAQMTIINGELKFTDALHPEGVINAASDMRITAEAPAEDLAQQRQEVLDRLMSQANAELAAPSVAPEVVAERAAAPEALVPPFVAEHPFVSPTGEEPASTDIELGQPEGQPAYDLTQEQALHEQEIGLNKFNLSIPIAEPHIYADTGAAHLFVYGGSPAERTSAILKHLTENPTKIIFSADDSGKYRISWHLVEGKVVHGAPMHTSGLFGSGLFSSFMKPPEPDDLEKLIK